MTTQDINAIAEAAAAPVPETSIPGMAPSATTSAPVTTPFAVFPDSASFKERMDREANRRLKEMGIPDPEQAKSIIAEHQRLKAEMEAKRLEEMSELDREREARTKAEAELARIRTAHEQAQRESSLLRLFSEHGIKNHAFATFALDQARAKAPDPSTFDEAAFLAAMKADPANAAALGIASVSTHPATTTTAHRDTPPANGAPMSGKSPREMTADEFREFVTKTTGFTP